MKKYFFVVVFVFTFFLSTVCSFGEAMPSMKTLMKEIMALKDRVIELESTVGIQKEEIKALNITHAQMGDEKVGKVQARKKWGDIFAHPNMPGNFKIGANMTAIAQACPNTKLMDRAPQNKIGGSYQANITIANKFEGINGLALANMRVDQGNGLEDRMTLYSNVDNNAWPGDTFTLSELFYEQKLLNDKLTIDFGKLDWTVYFDQSTYCDSDTTQFLARIFNHNPTLEAPFNTGGIRMAYEPTTWSEVSYMLMSSHDDWKNMGSDLFNIGRIMFKPKFGENQGYYRLYAWHNSIPHRRWDDPSANKAPAYGIGINCDQQINENVGVFGKFGWQNPKVYNPDVKAYPFSGNDPVPSERNYTIEYFWATGLEVKGHPWERSKDFCGLAIGQAIPSTYMKKFDDRKALPETHMEFYYNFFVNKYLALSPSVQLIWNAYGGDAGADDVVAVYTLRSHVDF